MMRLPKQVAPVQRPSTTAALPNQNGITASGQSNIPEDEIWKYFFP